MTHDIKLEIDGRKYALAPSQERKANDPIPFYITKKDMEFFMWVISDSITLAEKECYPGLEMDLRRIEKDMQHKIDTLIAKGEWK